VGGGRFTDLDRAGRAALRQAPPWFTELDTRVPADRRPRREAERWLHILLQTRGGGPVARTTPVRRRVVYEGAAFAGIGGAS